MDPGSRPGRRPGLLFLPVNERRIVEIDRRKLVLLGPVVLAVLPFRLVATLGQKMYVAHQITGIEILRIDPRLQRHVAFLRPQRGHHLARALRLHVAEEAADEVGDEIGAQRPAGTEIAEHPGHVRNPGEHHAAIGDGVGEIQRLAVDLERDIAFTIDGKPLDFAESVTYRGMMFTGIPNMAWVFGYFRASWTLRTDLVADFVCRLLSHMKQKGVSKVVPALRPQEDNMPLHSWIDPENFNPGYMMRDMHRLPKRGDKPEWQHSQDYWAEKDEFPAIDLDDAAFVYG